MLKNKKYII